MRSPSVLMLLLVLQVSVRSHSEVNSLPGMERIPDSLRTQAFAIVRNHSTTYTVKSADLGMEKVEKTITVTDKQGIPLADFYYPGDQFRKLTSFSATVYDAQGRTLKRFKSSDVRTSNYSENLATDDKSYLLSLNIPVLPYTVRYVYEVTWKNNSLQYPSFYPVSSPHLSVERAAYTLELDDTVRIRYKSFNGLNPPEKKTVKGRTSYTWSVSGIKAIVSERMMPEMASFIPSLFVRPQHFVYDRTEGLVTDWKSMGLWLNGLIKGRDTLTSEEVDLVRQMTASATSEREKVARIYDYFGKRTRYVSIQLGIGGYQPMSALEVSKTQFGDCKGLTVYLKALLAAAGIPSNYCCIYLGSGNETLVSDYPSFNQMNHVLLQVPLPEDTLWVECTNPAFPLGYVHEGINGHQALVLTDKGGLIHRLPDYPDSLNLESNYARAEINANGGAVAHSMLTVRGMAYEALSNLANTKQENQIDYLRKTLKLPQATVTLPAVNECKTTHPALSVSFTWETTAYGTKSGSRLFLPLNPFAERYDWLQPVNRVYPLDIKRGFRDVDTVELVIPPGYVTETCPEEMAVNTAFGSFFSRVEIITNGLRVVQSLTVYRGTYSRQDYAAVAVFFSQVSRAYAASIILIRKSTT